ncbi:MAG: FG-GAP-like repeat-containing protein, partial [Planctomycetota bacterium]
VLRIGGASAATELDVTVKCRYPRPLRRRIELSPLEPAITAFDPPNGWDGDVISIVGENFAAEGVEVRFGEIFSPKVVCASAVRVYATVPEAEGEATLVLINPDGQACEARVPFEFRGRPPVVASIAPDRGPDSGGTDVVLRGSGLTHVVSVRLGGVPVADGPVVLTHDKIRFTTPPGGPGPADLELTDRWGQVKHLASAFLYDAAPEIHTVNPRSGSLKGGTLVTVTGSGFSSGSKVFLDGEALFYVTILGPESLRFITPAHEKGVVDLRITDRYDRSVVKPGAYEFSDAVWVDISEDILPANTEIDAYAGRALAVEDLDDDGDIDIVVGRTADPELGFLTNLLLNDGTGSFEAAGLPLSPGNGDVWQATDLAVGDLDGDGDADLVLTCDTRFQANRQYAYFISGVLYFAHDRILPSTRILVNDGEGGFSLKTDSFPSLAVQGRDTMLGSSVVLGDVDGDNDLDLILTSDRCIGVSSYTQEPDGMTFRRYFSVVPEDDRPATRVFLNDGHAYFSDATATALPPAADGDLFAGDAVRLGNVDGDGDLDILITGEGDRLRDPDFAEYVKGSRTRVLRNDGKGNFTNDTSTFMPVPTVGEDWGGCGIALGDLDGDEWPDDLIVTSRRTLSAPTKGSTPLSSTRVLLGSAKGFSIGTGDWLPAIRSDGTGDRHRGRAAAIASIRGDSTAGIFLVGDTPVYGPDEEDGQISSLRWFRRSGELPLNNVSERLLPNPELSGHEYYGHALTFGDIDGDGEDELIITTEHPDLLKEGKRPTRVLQRR